MQGTSTLAANAAGAAPIPAARDGSADAPCPADASGAGGPAGPDGAGRGEPDGSGATSGWRLNVLGPVELCYDGEPVQVTGATRTLLALLARTPGEEMSTAIIVAGLWGSSPPEDSEKEVASHVSRLRKALTAVAPDVDPTRVVVTLPAGYILDIQPSNADVIAFERLIADGRRALAVGQPELALARLDSAIALWRGPAYEDFGDHAFARAEAARLDELRLTAIEARIEARLALAAPQAPDGLEAELRQLVARHWHRERLSALLMVTLFRLGRRGDALAVCRQAQQRLAQELGGAPGPDLRDAERAVIASDAALFGAPGVPMPVPTSLAATVPACVGRDQEVDWLLAAVDLAATRRAQARLIVGGPGIGKSRLVAEVAQRAAQRGVAVSSWRGAVTGLDTLPAVPDRVSLVVLDDLDQAPHEDIVTATDFIRAARSRPVVVLATCRDPVRVGDLQGVPKLVLTALDDDAVAEIVRYYAPGTVTATAAAAMVNTGGVPARVHRAASEWAFHRAGRRIDRAVADCAQPRRWLETVQSEVVGGVLDLAYVRDRARALLPATRAPLARPYLGPGRFEAADKELFHGRERLVADLVAGLVRSPVLAVVGARGTGKSSAVRAGLLPALAAGVLPDSGLWRLVLLTPATTGGALAAHLEAAATARPSLAAAAVAGAGPAAAGEAEAATAARGRDRPGPGASDPSASTSAPEPAPPEPAPPEPAPPESSHPEPDLAAAPQVTVLVVDQFDEIFTTLPPARREEFIATLVAAAATCRIVLTLRPETYELCANHPDLARLVSGNAVLVTPMTGDEIRRAVQRPAELAGVELEPGLADRIMADALSRPGDLVSLSTALHGTWQRRSGRGLTLAGYLEAGGVAEAVQVFAEEAYASLTPAERVVARTILLCLSGVGDAVPLDHPGAVLPRNVDLAQLVTVAGPGGSATLERLAERGVVRLTETVAVPVAGPPAAGSEESRAAAHHDGVELVQESLPQRWQRLRGWLAEIAAEAGLREHLSAAAQAWVAGGRSAAELYRGARLAAALDWAARDAGAVGTTEREFLSAAERLTLAAENRRRRRIVRLWKWLAASLVVAILAIAVAVVAVTQQLRTLASAQRADAARIAVLASAEPDLRLALLLAVAATRLDPSTTDTLRAVLNRAPDLMAIGGDGVSRIALSPDGLTVAAATRDGVQVMAAESLAPGHRLEWAGHGPVNGVAYTADGRRLVSWGGDATSIGGAASILVWDLTKRQPIGDAFGQAWPGTGGGLAIDGETLVLAQNAPDGAVRAAAWNVEARTPSTAYSLPAGEIDSLVLSPDGRIVIVAGALESVLVELQSGRVVPIAGARRPVAVSWDGRTLLTAEGEEVVVWDLATASKRATATGGLGEVTGAAFSPRGDVFASGAADGRITIWDAVTLRPVRVLAGNGLAVQHVIFDRDARTIYSVAAQGSVLAWDLTGTRGAGVTRPATDDLDALARTACAMAGRNITHDEWIRFLPGRSLPQICPD